MWVGKFAADFLDLSIISIVFVSQINCFILPFLAIFAHLIQVRY
jgi:hypothetical protein